MEDRDETLKRLLGGDEDEERQHHEAEAMVRQQQQSHQAYKYLIETSDKTGLNELLMRTVFCNKEEMVLFIDYVSWCLDFNISLDNAVRYAAARPAIDGYARRQLVEALNTFRWIEANRKKESKRDDKAISG